MFSMKIRPLTKIFRGPEAREMKENQAFCIRFVGFPHKTCFGEGVTKDSKVLGTNASSTVGTLKPFAL